MLRLSATRSLFERRDCVIVASVSCIYGLGSPDAYYGMLLMIEKGQRISREEIARQLVKILYERRDGELKRGSFRVVGDVIEILPSYDDNAYRIELWGDEIESLSQIDPLMGQVRQTYLAAADLPGQPLCDVGRDPQRRDREHSWPSWTPGSLNSPRKASTSKRSGCANARFSTSR